MVTLANPRTKDIDLYVNSYGTAMRFLRGKSQRKLANNTFVRQEDESSVSVVLHRTPIVTYYSTGLIVLRSGGYHTKTTAQRINQLLPPGWKLYQKKRNWYLRAPDGEEQDFFDGIAIHAGLRTHGEGSRRLPIRSKANLTEEEHAHLLSLSRQMTPPKYPGHQPNPPTISMSDIVKRVVPDDDPDTSYLDQDDFEEHRKAYHRGEFSFVGVYAEVVLHVKGIRQELRSAGLWGIEDDGSKSSQDYIEEVFKEERAQLLEILEEMGVKVTKH